MFPQPLPMDTALMLPSAIGRSKGRGPRWPRSPKGLRKMKEWPRLQHLQLLKKYFPRGNSPRPPKFANLFRPFGARCCWPSPIRTCGHVAVKNFGFFLYFLTAILSIINDAAVKCDISDVPLDFRYLCRLLPLDNNVLDIYRSLAWSPYFGCHCFMPF